MYICHLLLLQAKNAQEEQGEEEAMWEYDATSKRSITKQLYIYLASYSSKNAQKLCLRVECNPFLLVSHKMHVVALKCLVCCKRERGSASVSMNMSHACTMFGTLPRLILSQKLLNNIPVCVSWSPMYVCVCVRV